jgi:hypothetical protein
MLKNIKAEFSEFDLAETTSRKIRKNLNGIRKIKISSDCKAVDLNENDYSFRLIPTAVTTQNYITIPVISPLNEKQSISHRTHLSIICTEEVSPRVHQLLTSAGGLNISSETFIP